MGFTSHGRPIGSGVIRSSRSTSEQYSRASRGTQPLLKAL
jgi:hypothetical protein